MMSVFFSCSPTEETEVCKQLNNFAKTTEESVRVRNQTHSEIYGLSNCNEPSNFLSLYLSALNVHEDFANGNRLYMLLH